MTALLLPLPVAPATRPTLTVDLDAVSANVRTLRSATTARLMAVVKADGFGAGAADVARTALAAGADALGVTSLDEALALRRSGVHARVLSWLNALDVDATAAWTHGVELAVGSVELLEQVRRARTGGPVRVHLQLDCGLARDGAQPTAWLRLCRAAARAERRGEVRVVGVMGHLPRADEPAANADARARFTWGVRVAVGCGLRPVDRHLAATAATLTDPLSHHTMVRCGAGLVGIDPSGTTTLRSPFTLSAPLVHVREVAPGTPVGYGHTWRAPTWTRLGLVPVGYADGLPRNASGRASVSVAGRRVPVVGRISMDQLVVDLGDLPVGPGTAVTVLGPGGSGESTVADWAAWSGVLPHEVVTGFGARLRRATTGGES